MMHKNGFMMRAMMRVCLCKGGPNRLKQATSHGMLAHLQKRLHMLSRKPSECCWCCLVLLVLLVLHHTGWATLPVGRPHEHGSDSLFSGTV
jgi:hypothetical protein